MLSLRSHASIDLAEPLSGILAGRGALLYAATLVTAALLVVVRFARFYAAKQRVVDAPDASEELLNDFEGVEDEEPAAKEAQATSESEDADEPADLAEAPAPLVRLAVYDFDETLTRATYPQSHDGTPFGCMALSIRWEDPRAGAKRRVDTSPSKEFGGFDDARVEQLQRHFAEMRDQGWTLAVLSYNLQWDKGEFCLPSLLRHYGLLSFFTHQGTPLVYGLKDMRRMRATSKGDFVSQLVRTPRAVTGLALECAPRGHHLLVDDDEVNISGARACGLLGYQVSKRYEWDGLVGGLGRADPYDFAKLEAIGSCLAAPAAPERKRKRKRRTKMEIGQTRDARRWK